MPNASLRPCAEPHCPHLVHRGRCAQHTQQQDRVRGSSTQRGYDHRWRRYSETFRSRYPFCGMAPPGAPLTRDSLCAQQHRVRRAEVVDHIVPISGAYDARFYESTNHQALCQACHNRKRQRERGPGG